MRCKGWRLIEKRYKTPVGEIDLIMIRGRVLVFIEVKARQNLSDALYSITPQQSKRIIKASQWWLCQNPSYQKHILRFDAFFLASGRLPKHLRHIFNGA